MSNENEREFWLAGGNDLAKAKTFIAERGEAIAQMQIVAKAYGGIPISNGRSIQGLCFEGDQAPTGWIEKGRCEGRPFFMPKKASKTMRAIADELSRPRLKGAIDFHSLMCGGNGGVMKSHDGPGFGMRILYTSWEWIEDTLILAVPISNDGKPTFQPNGSRLLRMSEYWALRETSGKSEAA